MGKMHTKRGKFSGKMISLLLKSEYDVENSWQQKRKRTSKKWAHFPLTKEENKLFRISYFPTSFAMDHKKHIPESAKRRFYPIENIFTSISFAFTMYLSAFCEPFFIASLYNLSRYTNKKTFFRLLNPTSLLFFYVKYWKLIKMARFI